MSADNDVKIGTRVFKKTSSDGMITTYLGKRDFIDRGDRVDIIDGMVLIDETYVRDRRKIICHLLAAFRYGREDLDVLGLTFRKDLISQQVQVYPPESALPKRPLTRLQERLQKKLGKNAFPFWFEIPPKSASSVTLQPAPGDTGKPCGVDYELKTIVATSDGDISKPKKHNTVRLAIRKLTYAPYEAKPQPMVDVSREFRMSSGLLHMEVSLDKEMYYHGESISVNVHLQNNSNKTVKKLKISVVQVADICLFTTASYNCEVARAESCEGFPVAPGGTLSKVYAMTPLLCRNKDKRGLALDGQLKHEDTNLASSTIRDASTEKESLGIVVQYKVKVRASLAGPLGGDLVAELPFTLTHSKPPETPERRPSIHLFANYKPTQIGADFIGKTQKELMESVKKYSLVKPEEIDLIQWSEMEGDIDEDDDLIFEDFARLRLMGADSQDQPESSKNGGTPQTGSPSTSSPFPIPSRIQTAGPSVSSSAPTTPGSSHPPPSSLPTPIPSIL